jgi:hypothetical protein
MFYFLCFAHQNIPFPLEKISAILRSKRIHAIPFLWKVSPQNSYEKPLIQTGPYSPFFDGCIRAIDGTHAHVCVDRDAHNC